MRYLLFLQLKYPAVYAAVVKYLQLCPCGLSAFSGGAGIYQLHTADLFVAGYVGVSEKGDGGGVFKCCIVKGMELLLYVMHMPVADIDLYRAYLHRVPERGTLGYVTVAADIVKGDMGKLLPESKSVPLIVAQMNDKVWACTAQGLCHKAELSVAVRKNGGFHTDSFHMRLSKLIRLNIMLRERDQMQNFEKLGQELERMGKTEDIKRLAQSDAAQRISRMVDTSAVEKAAKSGDSEALKRMLSQVLSTDEGRKLAESVTKLMQGK